MDRRDDHSPWPHYCVEAARIYEPPEHPIPIVVSAFGPVATKVAARAGDGLWTAGHTADAIERWRSNGGSGPVYGQFTLCWGPDRRKAVELAHHNWRNGGLPGQLGQDLPTTTHFEPATSIVTPEMIDESMPCGPDTGAIAEQAGELIDAGVDHLNFHQIGDDQEDFCEIWRSEIGPALRRE